MSLLEKINSPADLKKLDESLLPGLAEEIRELIINTVADTGGHLAPNLGVVELSIALHRVFSCPRDKIIWDVGHQSYIHKILTERRAEFSSLRQYKGLCGFPLRSESVYDAFGTGHASTSISAALGMAVARDLKKEHFDIVAVIGDGSFTGGMSFEALNNAGDLQKKMLVVLNDNEMSIAKNVGALSEYLYRMRTAPTYSRIKRDIDSVLKSIPSIGDQVQKTVERVKNSVKFLLVPGMLFEELGFSYIGPVDGHNMKHMLEVFELARQSDRPTVVHVMTRKGKGYAPAEKKAASFHGVGPFAVETGDKLKTGKYPTYSEVFGQAMVELGKKDERIVAITAAMPDGTGLSAFAKTFPERFFDVGIAEQHAVTMAAGMACEGIKPVVGIYSTFSQRAYDQILHDVCLQKLPVVLALDRSGLVGDDGATHHGVFGYSFLRSMPNITLFAPKDENELYQMLQTALQHNSPTAIFYPRSEGVGVEIYKDQPVMEIGKAEVLSFGDSVAIWAVGGMVEQAKKVCRQLEERGVNSTLVNARFIKPLDENLLLEHANSFKHIITMEENVLAGGFGSSVLEKLDQKDLLGTTSVLTLGLPDEFVPHGNRELLLADLGLDVDGMTERIMTFCQKT